MEDNQKQAGNQQKETNINGMTNQLGINNSENKDNQVEPNSNDQITQNPELIWNNTGNITSKLCKIDICQKCL